MLVVAVAATTSATTACVGWRQTGRCDPRGPRVPERDKSCDAIITAEASGFCDCGQKQPRVLVACNHAALRCSQACAAPAAKPPPRVASSPAPKKHTASTPHVNHQTPHVKQTPSQHHDHGKAKQSEPVSTLATPILPGSGLLPLVTCADCRVVLDMRCNISLRTLTFHRVHNCLLPTYATLAALQPASAARLLAAANASSVDVSQAFCVLGEPDVAYPYIDALLHSRLRGYVDANTAEAACAESPALVVPQTRLPTPWLESNHTPDDVAWRLVRSDVTELLRRRRGDGALLAPEDAPGAGYLVLVARNKSRRFTLDAGAMAYRLSQRTAMPVRVYADGQSLEATIRLFALARGVVLYHGAALTNLAFARYRMCVVELTSYVDAANTQSPFLWCERMALWNPLVVCKNYSIPRAQTIQANKKKFPHHSGVRAVLDWFTNIQNVGVKLTDVDRVAAIARGCLAELASNGAAAREPSHLNKAIRDSYSCARHTHFAHGTVQIYLKRRI